jgi:hypothetical protein
MSDYNERDDDDYEATPAKKHRAYCDALARQERDMMVWRIAARKFADVLAGLQLPLGCPVAGYDTTEIVSLLRGDLMPNEDWRALAAMYAEERADWYDPGSDRWLVNAYERREAARLEEDRKRWAEVKERAA